MTRSRSRSTSHLLLRVAPFLAVLSGSGLALVHCSDDDPVPATGNAGTGGGAGTAQGGKGGQGGSASDGPAYDRTTNPNKHEVGDKEKGKEVFRNETFGNEGFWTDALRLPQGVVAAGFTPVMALKAGLMVDIDAIPAEVQAAVAGELATDLSPENAPTLNNPATTIALLNLNAVMGLVVKDSNKDGKLDVAGGDKVGLSCALCHSVADGSVFSLPNGGAIGKRIDGLAAHTLNVGAAIALGANSRAYYPLLQLKGPDGSTIGRGSHPGLTKDSTEEDVDAYLKDPTNYPVGTFDDTFDGNGNSMHNTPMFRTDLGAPWGSAGEIQHLDQFANTVYTALLDPTNLLQPGGRAFVNKVAGANGDAMLADYEGILTATGVTGYPFVKEVTTGTPGELDSLIGLKLDHQKLIDMNAYLDSLPAPLGKKGDATATAEGREIFRTTGCTNCHNVDQSVFVPPIIVDMKTIWPGDAPTVLLERMPPAGPVSNTPAGTFDDKAIVINATLRGLNRGIAVPLLLDLARKPTLLHDDSVPNLDGLLSETRGATAPHPFYVTNAGDRAKVVLFLQSLDTNSKLRRATWRRGKEADRVSLHAAPRRFGLRPRTQWIDMRRVNTHRTGIVGASGYTGRELTRLLERHPGVLVSFLTSDRWADTTVHTQLGPSGRLDRVRYLTEAQGLAHDDVDTVFLATPPEASRVLAPAFLAKGVRVIDLSNAYRVSPEVPAVYGLPELFRADIAAARLIANPGCYPTAAGLSLAPFFRAGLVRGDKVIVDAASGVSGAGRAVSEAYTLMELSGDFRAYKTLRHQHTPEIAQTFSRASGKAVRVTFTPHLLPIPRGILSTAYADVDASLDDAGAREILVAAYAAEPFVTVVASADDVALKQTIGTNQCIVGASCHDGQLVAVAAIDNLLKGAAGQAVQNLNLLLGLPETTGLDGLRRTLA